MAKALQIAWRVISLPIAAALLMLEPLVQFLCGAAVILGVVVSILFEISAVGPRFPFFQAIGISLSFGVLLFLYYAALSVFVAD